MTQSFNDRFKQISNNLSNYFVILPSSCLLLIVIHVKHVMASKAKVTPKKVAKKKNGYEMPKALKPGDVIEDNQKNKWKVGVSIGVGGFGEIYSACNVDSKIKNVKDYPYVVKIVSFRCWILFS